MDYNSFYGGRRGASFVITKSYSTIAEMVNAFRQGGAYKTVSYDDYVLIDTTNKNDPDNGKLYRRGYDYNNTMGGAIYEGQIVGPAGLAPHTEIDSVSNVEQIAAREGYEYRRGTGSYKLDDNSIVPGKYTESGSGIPRYNDVITWAYCSVKDVNSNESTAYIGFTFPYTVIDFTATLISPYKNGAHIDTTDVVRIDDETHPFYEKWNIEIPNGIKGDDLKNFRVMIADNTIQTYEGQEDDIANNRQVLVYDLYSYENLENGEYLTYYVGDYNKVSNITISEEGLITIQYSHDDTETYQIKIPTSVTINTGVIEGSGNQKIHIVYSNGTETDIGQPINYIMETALNEEFHLLIYYSSPEKREAIVLAGKNAIYDGKNDWLDLGYIGNGSLLNPIQNKIDELQNLIENNFVFKNKIIEASGQITDSLNWYIKKFNSLNANDIIQKTTIGKSILDTSTIQQTTKSGITCSYNSTTQEITLNGTCSADNTVFNFEGTSINNIANTTKLCLFYSSGYYNGTGMIRLANSSWGQFTTIYLNTISLQNLSEVATKNNNETYVNNMIRVNSGDICNNFKIKVMVTNSENTTFEEYSEKKSSPNPIHDQSIKMFTNNTNIKISNKNLFNENDTTSNLFYMPGTGEERAVDVWTQSNYIKMKPNEIITISSIYSIINNSFEVTEFNNKKEWLKTTQFSLNTPYTETLSNLTEYIRIGFRNDRGQLDLQIERGPVATSYIEHQEQLFSLTIPSSIYLGKLGEKENIIFKNTKSNPNYNSNLIENAWYWKKEWIKSILDGNNIMFNERGEINTTGKYRFTCAAIKGLNCNTTNGAIAYCNKAKLDGQGQTYAYEEGKNSFTITTDGSIYQIADIIEMNLDSANTWLTIHNMEVVYPLTTTEYTLISDATLLLQLEMLFQFLIYKNITNFEIINENINGILNFDYYIDDRVKLENSLISLEARVAALEDEDEEVSI